MNTRTLLLIAALALPCSAAVPPLAGWRASIDGVGPIRLGMSLDDVRRASGVEFVEQPDAGEVSNWDLCHYAWPASDGQLRLDLALVLNQGRVTRIEVVAPEIATVTGARVGDSESRLRALYAGRLSDVVAPGSAHLHLLVAGARPQALRFIMEDGKVEAYHVGTPAVSYPGGGCA